MKKLSHDQNKMTHCSVGTTNCDCTINGITHEVGGKGTKPNQVSE